MAAEREEAARSDSRARVAQRVGQLLSWAAAMQALCRDTWERIQPELRAAAGHEVFNAWLSELRPLALERGVLYLEGRNRMVCERVARLYASVIAACLKAELGTEIAVSVEPAPESLVPDHLEVGPARPVVDAANRTAFLLLRALLDGQDLPSATFFFYGTAGAGKTFLLDWWRNAQRRRCQHFDGPQLVKVFQAVMRDRRLPGLCDELCRPTPLVLDELHRVAGHTRIQKELCKVLEVRSGARLATLIASRWHPNEIRQLDPGLATWLLSGFVTRIEPPGPTARLAYLRALEGPRSRNGFAPVIERLARDVRGGFPELRRAWAFERHVPAHGRKRHWQLIEPQSAFHRLCDRVAERLGVPVDELCGRSQNRRASQARKVLAHLCVQDGLTRAEVGRFLGRTRAAISYSIKSLRSEMTSNDALRTQVESLW